MGIIEWLKDVIFGKTEKKELYKEKISSNKRNSAPYFHTSPNKNPHQDIMDEIISDPNSRYNQLIKEKKIKKKTTPKAKKNLVITDNQKRWMEVLKMRVNSMPMDFIERLGYTVDSLGRDHANEYKSNEFRVPEDVREEVALDRVTGLYSIRDYIQAKGSKAQKFHLDASIKGALLYATSLGLNVDKYKI